MASATRARCGKICRRRGAAPGADMLRAHGYPAAAS